MFLSADNTITELEKKKAKSNLCLMNNNIFNYLDELKIHSLDEEGQLWAKNSRNKKYLSEKKRKSQLILKNLFTALIFITSFPKQSFETQRGREIDNKGKTPRMYKIERISAFLLWTWKSSLWSNLSWLMRDWWVCPRQNSSDKDMFVCFSFILKSKAQYVSVPVWAFPHPHSELGYEMNRAFLPKGGEAVTPWLS